MNLKYLEKQYARYRYTIDKIDTDVKADTDNVKFAAWLHKKMQRIEKKIKELQENEEYESS